MKWVESAPSNIAWIKYMGKTDHAQNLPTNISLSYTVEYLRTTVELELADTDSWQPLAGVEFYPLDLSDQAKERYLRHLAFLKKQFACEAAFTVRSANNFPASCGIASSASSFAALTRCFASAIIQMKKGDANVSVKRLSDLSRQGSGSSCRSFYSPWSKWDDEGASEEHLPYKDLVHMVVVCGAEEKDVSTSQAHKRVSSSKLFVGRPERATQRYHELVSSLKHQAWKSAHAIAWAEFWDMHSLFETSQVPFGYMNAGSLKVLSAVRRLWTEHGDGPIVTMDAGPNVHLFFRSEQSTLASQFAAEMEKYFLVLSRFFKTGVHAVPLS